MHITTVCLHPEMVLDAFRRGVCGRALESGVASLRCVNPRDFAAGPHRSVDDRPYGGGPGMVLSAEPLLAAVRAARAGAPGGAPVIFLTPQGRRFTQRRARELAAGAGMVLVAGRYEGIDERVVELEADEELSLGDFVLSGGELAACAVIDAVVRLLPGALGDDRSAGEDSFSVGLLDFPQYTRPAVVEGRAVPEVLLSGDHEQVRTWRLKQSLGRTWVRRPELLTGRDLSEQESRLLAEFQAEYDIKIRDAKDDQPD
ncbi:MAG: tRNA (guanosine(37)-N1)-methyltransferase TrmD [Gammaproteobacteria bacterium]|nr:tRNA (guanosine(37)-N1)-methyltransferase TrmD [Gammaproteobacteria bacterium]